jgi:hypothetical protein
MVELKFIDGTPVPDDYLQSISLLVRDAALAIDMFGEDELESASRFTAQEASVGGMSSKRCCVCGEEIFDGDESAFGACEDCLDKAHREPDAFIEQKLLRREYVLRTRAGADGDADAAYPTLNQAIAAFHATPVNSNARVMREGTTLAALDRKLEPVFLDAEAARIHRELFGGFMLRTYAGRGQGDLDTAHPTLESAMAAFAAAPPNALPRILRDGRTIAGLDPEAGLSPIFVDDEVRNVYYRIVDHGGPDQDRSEP